MLHIGPLNVFFRETLVWGVNEGWNPVLASSFFPFSFFFFSIIYFECFTSEGSNTSSSSSFRLCWMRVGKYVRGVFSNPKSQGVADAAPLSTWSTKKILRSPSPTPPTLHPLPPLPYSRWACRRRLDRCHTSRRGAISFAFLLTALCLPE